MASNHLAAPKPPMGGHPPHQQQQQMQTFEETRRLLTEALQQAKSSAGLSAAPNPLVASLEAALSQIQQQIAHDDFQASHSSPSPNHESELGASGSRGLGLTKHSSSNLSSPAGSHVNRMGSMGNYPRVGSMNPTTRQHIRPDAKIVDESLVDREHVDGDIVTWLNTNYAEDHHRVSTGFEVKLQRTQSLVSMAQPLPHPSPSYQALMEEVERTQREEAEAAAAAALNSTGQEDTGGGHHFLDVCESSLLQYPGGVPSLRAGNTPNGNSTIIPTLYQRKNQRSYRTFASDRKVVELLSTVGIDRITNINSPDFNIFQLEEQYKEKTMVVVAANVFLQYNFMSSLQLNATKMISFFTTLQSFYRPRNPYHNALHAADVLQTTNVYLCCGDVKENFSDVELLAILFGAIIHDVGHLGISNAFLCAIRHPFALLYNDQSCLENAHLALSFLILELPENNFFQESETWTRNFWIDFRNLVVEAVMGTDMKYHASLTQNVISILEDGVIEDDEVPRLFKAIVHAADLSNPMKPLPVYLEWCSRVMAEFWQQGDEERKRGLPISSMCDRHSPAIAKSQIGFSEFVVRPFMKELAPVLPPVWLSRLGKNNDFMKNLSKEREESILNRIAVLSAPSWEEEPLHQLGFLSALGAYVQHYVSKKQLELAYKIGQSEHVSPGTRRESMVSNGTSTNMQSGSKTPPQDTTLPKPAPSDIMATITANLDPPSLPIKAAQMYQAHQGKMVEVCETWSHHIEHMKVTATEAGFTDNGLLERMATAWVTMILHLQAHQRHVLSGMGQKLGPKQKMALLFSGAGSVSGAGRTSIGAKSAEAQEVIATAKVNVTGVVLSLPPMPYLEASMFKAILKHIEAGNPVISVKKPMGSGTGASSSTATTNEGGGGGGDHPALLSSIDGVDSNAESQELTHAEDIAKETNKILTNELDLVDYIKHHPDAAVEVFMSLAEVPVTAMTPHAAAAKALANVGEIVTSGRKNNNTPSRVAVVAHPDAHHTASILEGSILGYNKSMIINPQLLHQGGAFGGPTQAQSSGSNMVMKTIGSLTRMLWTSYRTRLDACTNALAAAADVSEDDEHEDEPKPNVVAPKVEVTSSVVDASEKISRPPKLEPIFSPDGKNPSLPLPIPDGFSSDHSYLTPGHGQSGAVTPAEISHRSSVPGALSISTNPSGGLTRPNIGSGSYSFPNGAPTTPKSPLPAPSVVVSTQDAARDYASRTRRLPALTLEGGGGGNAALEMATQQWAMRLTEVSRTRAITPVGGMHPSLSAGPTPVTLHRQSLPPPPISRTPAPGEASGIAASLPRLRSDV